MKPLGLFILSVVMLLTTVTTTQLYAASEPKLQLLYVEMAHCPWCHRMEEEIFKNPKWRTEIQKHYTIRKIEKSEEALPLDLKPRFFPTTYILSADDTKLLDELPGYMEPDRFLDYLTELYELETKKD